MKYLLIFIVLFTGAVACGQSSDWKPISSAPRDGTVIELKNDYGIAPSYSLAHWSDDQETYNNAGAIEHRKLEYKVWTMVAPGKGEFISSEGPFLTWRPYVGEISKYVDPVGNADQSEDYWRHAAARAVGLPENAYDAEAKTASIKRAKSCPLISAIERVEIERTVDTGEYVIELHSKTATCSLWMSGDKVRDIENY